MRDLFHEPIWEETEEPEAAAEARGKLLAFLDADPVVWGFWRRWYQAMFDGRPMDWELQRRVALIPDSVWEDGPAAVSERIRGIEADLREREAEDEDRSRGISDDEIAKLKQRVDLNRDALAVSITGLLEQIAQFREYVRGLNGLDPEYRESLLAFLDNLRTTLDALLSALPEKPQPIPDDRTRRMIVWVRDLRSALVVEAKKYLDPGNVAGAAIPTAIILGCTGVGAMLGMPVAGTVVGGLITGQIKPGKAAEDLLAPH